MNDCTSRSSKNLKTLKVKVANADWSNISDEESTHGWSRIYVHGSKLQSFFKKGDQCVVLNREDFPTHKTFVSKDFEEIDVNDVLKCEVQDYPYPCYAFVWTMETSRGVSFTLGLVVDETDDSYLKDALMKFVNRYTIL